MIKLLKKYRNLFIEILIIAFVLPTFSGIIYAFSEEAGNVVLDLVGEIPLFEVWFSIIKDLAFNANIQESLQNYLENWLSLAVQASFQVYIIGFVSDIAGKLTDNALTVIPKVIAVTLSTFVINLTPEKAEYIISEALIILVLYILLLKFILKTRIFSTIFKLIFGILIEIYIVCSICTYISVLALIAGGKITEPLDMVWSLTVTVSLVLLSILIKDIFNRIYKKK